MGGLGLDYGIGGIERIGLMIEPGVVVDCDIAAAVVEHIVVAAVIVDGIVVGDDLAENFDFDNYDFAIDGKIVDFDRFGDE